MIETTPTTPDVHPATPRRGTVLAWAVLGTTIAFAACATVLDIATGPGVRELYPSTSKFARRGEGNFNGAPEALPAPTVAPPGSAEKVAVLEQRLMRRQSLWHRQRKTQCRCCGCCLVSPL